MKNANYFFTALLVAHDDLEVCVIVIKKEMLLECFY